MPKLSFRKPTEAPRPTLGRTSRKNRDRQQSYDGYIRALKQGDIGDLELDEGETLRSVIVLLRRASARLGVPLDIWDAEGHVYFKPGIGKKGKQLRAIDVMEAEDEDEEVSL